MIQQKVQKYHSNKFGGFLTTGIETGKFRLALEYNLLPSSSVVISNYNYDEILNEGFTTQMDDKVRNSYFAVSVGIFMGGGKWRK